MTPVEIIALVFSVLVLLKLILLYTYKKPMLNLAKILAKNTTGFTISFTIIAIILGYYIFQELNIIQVAAVTFFAVIIIDLSLTPIFKPLIKNINKIVNSKYMWIFAAIWGIFAALTLYTLYNLYF
jgi:hypothetical protein